MLKQTVQRTILLAGITPVSLSSAALSAQANNPGAQKWETEIAAFEAAKRQRKYHYAGSGHARQTRSTACIRRSTARRWRAESRHDLLSSQDVIGIAVPQFGLRHARRQSDQPCCYNKNKPTLNLTVREEQRNKLEQMASLENRSVSNLIEVMADERWQRLAEQQGVAYAKTVAEAMNLKLDADNPADREKLRRAVLDLVAERKIPKQKGRS